MEGVALAQSCVSQSQVRELWRMLHLHNPVFHRAKSGDCGECCACTILCFTEPSQGIMQGVSEGQVGGLWRVLHLHNPVFHRAKSGDYGVCCACTILCFTEPSQRIMEGVALAQSCVSQSQVRWLWKVLHLHNLIFCQKYFVQKVSKLASHFFSNWHWHN